MLSTIVLLFLCGLIKAEYDCLCNYNDDTPVLQSAKSTSSKIGDMYEFDCKPIADVQGSASGTWKAIAFEHQLGFVEMNEMVKVQVCPGNPSSADLLTTKSLISTTEITMTSKITTTLSSSPSTALASTTQTTLTASHAIPVTTPHSLLGDISLCPASVRLYAQQDNEILAQHDMSCYTVVPQKLSWEHAENICYHRGGYLFHVKSATENNFIYNLLNSRFNHSVWMGLHDRIHEEHFSWISGSPVNYTNWYPYRKNNDHSHNAEDCAVFKPYLNRGQWDDTLCGISSSISLIENIFERHYFICQFGITVTQPSQTASAVIQGNTNLCPSRLHYLTRLDHGTLAQYGNSCYEWVNKRSSWTHAEQICGRNGGHLVQVNDAQEETFIQQFMTVHDSRHAIWIGLHDREHEETFSWTSGEPVVYTNWMPGRKSNFESHTSEDCVTLVPYMKGQWDDIPCGSHLFILGDFGETHPFMCEYKIGGVSSGIGTIIG